MYIVTAVDRLTIVVIVIHLSSQNKAARAEGH